MFIQLWIPLKLKKQSSIYPLIFYTILEPLVRSDTVLDSRAAMIKRPSLAHGASIRTEEMNTQTNTVLSEETGGYD